MENTPTQARPRHRPRLMNFRFTLDTTEDFLRQLSEADGLSMKAVVEQLIQGRGQARAPSRPPAPPHPRPPRKKPRGGLDL